MRKTFAFVIMMVVMGFLLQLTVIFFKTKHDVSYVVEIDEKEVSVLEFYRKTEEEDYYLLNLEVDDSKFTFTIDNYFNKQKQILKDIIFYEKDNLLCAYPIYMNDKNGSDFTCSLDGKNYAYSALKDTYDLSEYIEKLPSFTYSEGSRSDKIYNNYDMEIYYENFIDNEYIFVYDYYHVIAVYDFRTQVSKVVDFDKLVNEHGIFMGKKFYVPYYVEGQDYFDHFQIIDLLSRDDDPVFVSINEKISTNSYINGVYENLIYFFDRDSKRQYVFDIEEEEVKVVGHEEKDGVIYKDGKFEVISVSELANEDHTFSLDFSELKDYEIKEAFRDSKYYYFYTKDGEFYKSFIDNTVQNPVLLFKLDDLSNFQILDDKIYFIQDTKLYRFYQYNLVPLLERDDWHENKLNIYSAYWK